MFVKNTLFVITMLAALLSRSGVVGAETNVDEIMQKVVENLNGKTAVMVISMQVKTNRAQRNMKMKSYSEVVPQFGQYAKCVFVNYSFK